MRARRCGRRDVRTSSRSVFDTFDDEHGGFGSAPKFPLTAPLELALDLYRETEDAAMAHIVEVTLDAMGWGGLYDEVDGGFFRCAAARDWQRPHQREAARRQRQPAADVRRGVRDAARRALSRARRRRAALRADVAGRSSRRRLVGIAAGRPRLLRRPRDARQARTPPKSTACFYAGWNAQMVSATLRAAELLDDTALGEFALKSLERIVVACYSPGAGIAHCLDGRPSCAGCSTIRSRWPPRISTPTPPPATSSTR